MAKKRKSLGSESESPQTEKKFKPGKTANGGQSPKSAGTPKIKKEPNTPKSPQSAGKANIKKEASSPQSARIKMFGGTGTLNSAKKIKAEVAGKSDGEDALNRHKKRRLQRSYKRKETRQKLKELFIRVDQGDTTARHEVEEKIKALEKLEVRTKNCEKKLKSLKKILGPKSDATKQKQKQILPIPNKNKQKQTDAKAQKQQKGKQKPVPVKVQKPESQSDEEAEEEEESDELEAEEESGDEEESSDEANETTLSLDNSNQASDDDDSEDEASEEGEDEESSDEEENIEESTTPVQRDQKTKNQQAANKNMRQNTIANDLGKGKTSRYVVFVGNLPYTATKEELKEHFKKSGDIADIRIPTDQKTGKPKGFAYVELKAEESYQKALSLHHTFLGGRRINVLYTQGGKKKSDNKKGEIKAKNLKLQAMRKQGQLSGSVKDDQKRSVRRAKKKQFDKKQNA